MNDSSLVIESSWQIESQLEIEPSIESPSLGIESPDKVQEVADSLQSSGMDEISVPTIEDSLCKGRSENSISDVSSRYLTPGTTRLGTAGLRVHVSGLAGSNNSDSVGSKDVP